MKVIRFHEFGAPEVLCQRRRDSAAVFRSKSAALTLFPDNRVGGWRGIFGRRFRPGPA